MDAQRTVSFINLFLAEMIRRACWSGFDGECRWMVNQLAQIVGGDQADATLGEGEGSPRCAMVIVGQLGGVLEFGDVGCW